MRIAMFTDAFFPFASGVTTAVIELANMMAEAGHDIFIQAPRPKEPVDLSFLHPRVHVHYVRAIDVVMYPDFRLSTSIPLFLKEIRAFKPDLIHVHTPLSIGLEGTLIAKRLKLPVVQTFHTYHMDHENLKMMGINNERIGPLFEKGGWKAMNALARLYDATFVPTESVKNDLIEHNCPGEILLTPNILSQSALHRFPKTRRQPKNFIYVARQSFEKRIDLLLRAFALMHQQDPDLILHLIGSGPAQTELFALSLKLGIGPNIRWYGRIPHDDLLKEKHYQKGEIFLTASRYETFGYTTLEALAQGLPVVAIDYRANKEIVGPAGWLVSDTDDETLLVRRLARAALKALEADHTEMHAQAYEQAQKYTPAKLLPVYEAVYQSVLKS